MRAEKKILTKEYVARLNASPFFIVVNYKGLKVAHLTELRKRLLKAGAEVHIVKNSVFRVAAKEAGVGELERRAGRATGRGHRTEGHFRRREGAEEFCRGI
jgi:large subunit ribosomal protein L10